MSDEETTLKLDRYQRDNLLALLHLIYQQPGGLSMLGTGDWIGEIYWKIAERGFDPAIHRPNQAPSEQLEKMREWRKP